MESILNSLYYVVPFIVLLGILVFVHEFGHFLIARLCGVRVTDFSIGFGKELWSFTDKHQTKWKLCLVPLGGYCQFLGDADGASAGEDTDTLASLSEDDKKHAFAFQNPWKKLAIVLGGPGFNYLFAIVVFALMFALLGKFTFPPVVGEVLPDGAAFEAGIKQGDRIMEINGHKIKTFGDISTEISLAVNGEADVSLLRDGEQHRFTVKLKKVELEENGTTVARPMLGIKSQSSIELDHEKLSLPQAVSEAVSETWRITTGTLRGIKQMIVGERGTEDLGGILRIAEMSGDITKKTAGLILWPLWHCCPLIWG